MNFVEKKFRLHGITQILGSVSSDREIYTNYIASKAKTAEEAKNAAQDEEFVEGAPKTTGFYKDPETGYPVLMAYQIKGFLKAAAKTLAPQLNITATTSKIDNLVFIKERYIPFFREDGTPITEPDGYLERPLRAETPQGPRVGLAKSEVLQEWMVEFTVMVLENKKTAKSEEVTMDKICEMMEYGMLKGLSQWRNGGNGSFTYEVIE